MSSSWMGLGPSHHLPVLASGFGSASGPCSELPPWLQPLHLAMGVGQKGETRTRRCPWAWPPGHALRGLSAPGPGELALSLFFLRRLSIQLELERVVKLESARELRRMFLPDMMSSPKPSWWEKA